MSKHLPGLFLFASVLALSPAINAAAQEPEPGIGEAERQPPAQDAAFEVDAGYDQIELFTRVLEIVRQNYVDQDKATYEELIANALEGMLAGLDPHSQFMQKPIFEQLKKSTGSTYDGVGITIATKNEALTIVAVREDGPAARAGVLAGDQILRINQIAAERIGLAEAISLLKGKPGESLSLTLRRPANKELIEVEMIREVIQRETVRDTRLLPESIAGNYKIGYIRLLQFSGPTATELKEQLDYLEGKGMQAFVLDLRNNPGGLLNSAVDVCGEFLEPNTLVLTTEGRPDITDVSTYFTDKTTARDRRYPMAILVNHASASGAEVVAGALQDLNRAIIVGSTTFGKGSVQSIMPVGSDTAIRLTTAKYYTPSKRTIHENGVIPNIIVTLTPAEESQLLASWRQSELEGDEKKEADDFRDRQLDRAVDALKGALVYDALARKDGDKPKSRPQTQPRPQPSKSSAEAPGTTGQPAATEKPKPKPASAPPAGKPE